ncbi:Bromodomain-containing protein [Xylona heveae TC161]|uniref:Bromodomain-containing protein n=1 Tax=Xylona heveae (strain CBS 132557 / TC161) TaxID=1328760 RepID=A0A164ZC14_XYLHT|nr:Bromodomain-containing protein [Xylona heveae TC161]KZF18916.1 Bromodomain-containing protein [Xylona heveae TC161]
MASGRASASPTPLPSTETDGAQIKTEDSNVTEHEWEAMQSVLANIYAHRNSDGHDPSKHFHRKVNRRITPDYYDVIKEPMALSTIKQRINAREYKNFSEFVRDFALIPHNAQLYNRPEALVYHDALTFKAVLEAELQKLVDRHIVSAEVTVLPDLGEIPPASPQPINEEDDDEEEEEEEEEEDDGEDSDEEGVRRRRKRASRMGAIKRDGGASKDDAGQKGNDADSRKRRGRPPRVDTPMETRIKNILKGIRKLKNPDGQLKVAHFEKLPDKATMPEYFQEIKTPLAIDIIKRKQKRKKYQSVDHFMKDMEIMFENAKMYNEDESQIYKDAVELQVEARKLAEIEMKKPDSELMMEDGRMPLDYILHNGELWKVGDWVHIQNPNDVTKPIVAQIYRTWQDAEGQKWVNACWYYRPEQTVHRYERHFFEHEVVKTGQYRDHHVDELVDKCYVMFFTRFNKGRPRGFPSDKEVYVCEARYNEENKRLNKIKTWASCLPDEVREKDYEMDLFDVPRKMKKVPSPIKHLLKADAKEDDPLPEPTWGAENAPPIVGAVHRRPRESNESPPPEPTPSPPPQPPATTQPVRQASSTTLNASATYGQETRADMPLNEHGRQSSVSVSTPAPSTPAPISYQPQNAPQATKQSASPAPALQHTFATQPISYSPHPPQTPFSTAQQPSFPGAQVGYGFPPPTARPSLSAGTMYNPPKPVEVYHLSDAANLAIPEDIRDQFHQDGHGRILFFTTPPLYALPEVNKGEAVGHSARYLAAKAKRGESLQRKRKLANATFKNEVGLSKKIKLAERTGSPQDVARLAQNLESMFEKQMEDGTMAIYQKTFGEKWEEVWKAEATRLRGLQERASVDKGYHYEQSRAREERDEISFKRPRVFLDDFDPRF